MAATMMMSAVLPSSVSVNARRRGRGATAAAHQRSCINDDVVVARLGRNVGESSSSSSASEQGLGVEVTRRAALFAFALVQARPAAAATELVGREVSGADAFITLMDGRDAVRDASGTTMIFPKNSVVSSSTTRRANHTHLVLVFTHTRHAHPSSSRAPPSFSSLFSRNTRQQLIAAMELQGTPEGGKRARVRNLLPRYASKAKAMTVVLPAAITAAYGAIAAEEGGAAGGADGTAGAPEAGMIAMEDILVGSKNLVTLAAYVSESRSFEDEDIPQATFAAAVSAIDAVLAAGSTEEVRKASAERCRRLIASAVDYEEMKSFASTPACNNI